MARLAASDNTLPLAEAMNRWSRLMFPVACAVIVYAFWTT